MNCNRPTRRILCKRLTIPGIVVFIFLISVFQRCEQQMPLSSLEHSAYAETYIIEGDFFPSNLAKSVLRIDRTFALDEKMSVGDAHVTEAYAELRSENGSVLSTLSWRDSARAYPFYWQNVSGIPGGPQGTNGTVTGVGDGIDTLHYGAYKLDRLDFQLSPYQQYELVVEIGEETFRTSFSPHPPVRLLNREPDSSYLRKAVYGGQYQVSSMTLDSNTIEMRWEDQPESYYYTVYLQNLHSTSLVPRVVTVPEPLFTYTVGGRRYEMIIGSMNETIYRHYYLTNFPVNHPLRNFFDGEALGYAGTLSEVYLELEIERR